MPELTLTQTFSLIALNAQRSLEMTTPKKVALRCMAASVMLEFYLEHGRMNYSLDTVTQYSKQTPYEEVIIQSLMKRDRQVTGDLEYWVKRASQRSTRALRKFERAVVSFLEASKLLEEIPHVLGSDFYFESTGVTIKQYRSDITIYSTIVESIRAETLEEGLLTDDTICLLWLLRESGSMREIFSRTELERVNERLNALHPIVSLVQELFRIRISHGWQLAIKRFLQMKKEITRTPLGKVVNFAFPVIERSQAVFIETETLITDPTRRLHFVIDRLIANGNVVSIIHEGTVPILRIDNLDHELIPDAIYGRFPIYGVRLLPRSLI